MAFIIDILIDLTIPAVTAFIGFFIGKKIKVEMKVDINRMDEEKQKTAKKGIILILSRYTPFTEKAKSMSEGDIQILLERKDYNLLDIENSSLGHGVTSILTHAANLDDCWLICSYTRDSGSIKASSINFAETFVEYLKREKGLKCNFHYGKHYAIPMDDDALICGKAYQITNNIFKVARKNHKLKPKDIIVDVTGGTRSMNLGLTLASLHKDRDIQIIGTSYNDDGSPVPRNSYPVKISFNPKIK